MFTFQGDRTRQGPDGWQLSCFLNEPSNNTLSYPKLAPSFFNAASRSTIKPRAETPLCCKLHLIPTQRNSWPKKANLESYAIFDQMPLILTAKVENLEVTRFHSNYETFRVIIPCDTCPISSVFGPLKMLRYPFDMLNRDASFLPVMSDP